MVAARPVGWLAGRLLCWLAACRCAARRMPLHSGVLAGAVAQRLQPTTACARVQALEGRSLIKAVKNVNNPAKKLYMLADLEPSIEITGGAWCVRACVCCVHWLFVRACVRACAYAWLRMCRLRRTLHHVCLKTRRRTTASNTQPRMHPPHRYSGQQLDTEFINVLAETAFKFIRAHEVRRACLCVCAWGWLCRSRAEHDAAACSATCARACVCLCTSRELEVHSCIPCQHAVCGRVGALRLRRVRALPMPMPMPMRMRMRMHAHGCAPPCRHAAAHAAGDHRLRQQPGRHARAPHSGRPGARRGHAHRRRQVRWRLGCVGGLSVWRACVRMCASV
jgi:hypothetical protein